VTGIARRGANVSALPTRRRDVSTQDDAIAALRRGEISGLGGLVELHQLKARRTAYLILGDAQAAEDVVAEAFLRVWARIGRYDASRPFEPWFYRIVVNLAIDDRRRRGRTQPDATIAEPAAPDGALVAGEARADLEAELRALPPVERAVVVLRYYHDLEEPQIAAVLDCPVGTVKSRLHRARERLRVRLAADPTWAPAPSEGA
jgi:RNA polymerase sigma-70 factor (ECF subfamily)